MSVAADSSPYLYPDDHLGSNPLGIEVLVDVPLTDAPRVPSGTDGEMSGRTVLHLGAPAAVSAVALDEIMRKTSHDRASVSSAGVDGGPSSRPLASLGGAAATAAIVDGVAVQQNASPGVLAGPSVVDRVDGPQRKIQQSYWEQGKRTGIYYLFLYIFSISSEKRSVLDEIYAAVANAVEQKETVQLDKLATTLLQSSAHNKHAVILLMIENFDMVQHALGVGLLAEELLAHLHSQNIQENCDEMFFLNILVMQVVGKDVLLSLSTSLLPDNLRSRNVVKRSVLQCAADLLASAKKHPFYNKMQELFGTDALFQKTLVLHAFEIIKKDQTDYTRYWGGVEQEQVLKDTHEHFDRYVMLYFIGNEESRRALVPLLARFPKPTPENFSAFCEYFTANHAEVAAITIFADTPEKNNRTRSIVGDDYFFKLQAVLQLTVEYKEQNYRAVNRIISHFARAGAELLTPAAIQEFFNAFESDIRGVEWVIEPGQGAGRVISYAVFTGFEAISTFLNQEVCEKLAPELAYWLVMEKQPTAPLDWNEHNIDKYVGYVKERITLAAFIEAVTLRRGDFVGMIGPRNTALLERHLAELGAAELRAAGIDATAQEAIAGDL